MFFQSFRVRVTFLFGVLALVLASLLSYQLGSMLTREMLKSRGDALQSLAGGVALMMSEGLAERMRETTLLAHSVQSRGRAGAEEWRSEIERLKAGRPHYAWIGVADVKGTVISASNGILEGKDVSDRPWFRAGLRAPFLGDPHPAKLLAKLLPRPENDEPLRFIDFAAPLAGRSGEAVGTLGVHADWRWARDVIAKLRSDDARDAGVLVYVLDREGRTIHGPRGPEGAQTLQEGAMATPRPEVKVWSDRERYLTVAVPVPSSLELPADLGWTVLVRQPEPLALVGIRYAKRSVWVWAGLACGAAMVAAWGVAGYFGRPLGAISQAAERIALGDREVRIPRSPGTQELERLSTSLLRMTEHLLTREAALRDANNTLEARVQERTVELARVNAELASTNESLDRLAHLDGLTELVNRRSLDQLLDQELAQHNRYGRPLGVLMCDLDHFKSVNDRHGHAAGDLVLKAVALCLRRVLRESDIAGRFGGEEFLVVLPETNAEGIFIVAEKIRQAVAALEFPGVGSQTMSVGGAVAESGRNSVEALLERADTALYRAKHAGRNRVVLADGDGPL